MPARTDDGPLPADEGNPVHAIAPSSSVDSGSSRALLRDLFTLKKAPPQWRAGLQAAVALTLPLFVFTLLGQPTAGLVASLGGFIVLHLPDRSRRERASKLPIMMAGYVVAGVVGVATCTSALGSLIGILLVALASSLLGLGFGVGSPGSMFYVLIAGAVGTLVAPVSEEGAGLNALFVLTLLVVGLVVAYLVIVAPLAIPAVLARDRSRFPDDRRWRFHFGAEVRRIFVRLSIATVLCVALSGALGLHRVHWTLLATIAILQKDSESRLSILRALHRILGTAVALVVFAVIARWNPDGIPLVVLIALLMYLWEILAPRNLGLALVAITPMALVIASKGAGQPLSEIVVVRIEDTALGAGVAISVLIGVSVVRQVTEHTHHRRRST